jgi:glycosyltransferase involved in cell wall biosynthesis
MFSVLIPVYNGDIPLLFDKALKSIIDNDLKADQILLIVDGPVNDNIENVIIKYNNYIDVIRMDINKGLPYSLNYALQHVKHPYVIRCDSDDINMPDRFSKLINELENGYDVVGSWIKEYDINGVFLNNKKVPLNHKEIINYAKIRNPMNHMSVAFKKNIILEAGGYPLIRYMEDYALWIKLMTLKHKFKNIPFYLVNATTGNAMYARRRGFSYILQEFRILKFMISLKFINIFNIFIFLLFRIVVRFFPVKVIGFFYKILRKFNS